MLALSDKTGTSLLLLLLSARHVVPMTKKEAETIWKFHKQSTCCKAEAWNELTKKKKIIGFECECGYRHVQKKHVVTVG